MVLYKNTTRSFYKEGIETFEKEIDSAVTTDLTVETLHDWFEHEKFKGYKLKEVYWVSKPFEYARIHVHEDKEDDLLYERVTPTFEEDKDTENLFNSVDINTDPIYNNYNYPEIYDKFAKELESTESTLDITEISFYKMIYNYMKSEVYGDLTVPINDEKCNFVRVTVNRGFYVRHLDYDISLSLTLVPEIDRIGYINKIEDKIFDEYDEDMNQKLCGKYSVKTTSDTYPRQLCISEYKNGRMNPPEFVLESQLNAGEVAYLWKSVMENKNIIIYGGAGTGTKRLLNALTYFVPNQEHIPCIQYYDDMITPKELDKTRGKNAELESILRDNPDRIFYGELRNNEAEKLFDGIESGIPLYASIHANSLEGVIDRLTNPPMNVNTTQVDSIDVFIRCYRQPQSYQISEFGSLDGIKSVEDCINTISSRDEETQIVKTSTKFGKMERLIEYLAQEKVSNNEQVYDIIREFTSKIKEEDVHNINVKKWLEDTYKLQL